MATFAIVRGEEELGVQAFCLGCKSWWPMGVDFWPNYSRHANRCRACTAEINHADYTGKVSRRLREPPHVADARREYWRLAQQRCRAKKAA